MIGWDSMKKKWRDHRKIEMVHGFERFMLTSTMRNKLTAKIIFSSKTDSINTFKSSKKWCKWPKILMSYHLSTFSCLASNSSRERSVVWSAMSGSPKRQNMQQEFHFILLLSKKRIYKSINDYCAGRFTCKPASNQKSETSVQVRVNLLKQCRSTKQ